MFLMLYYSNIHIHPHPVRERHTEHKQIRIAPICWSKTSKSDEFPEPQAPQQNILYIVGRGKLLIEEHSSWLFASPKSIPLTRLLLVPLPAAAAAAHRQLGIHPAPCAN